mgnify:CR=1 FL=1
MLGIPFVVPPPMIAASQASRLLLAGPPLYSSPAFPPRFLICRALHRSPGGGAPLKPRPPSRYAAFPHPNAMHIAAKGIAACRPVAAATRQQ